MTLEIPVKESDARLWRYFLRKKYKSSKAQLPRLAKMAILTEVAAQAELDLSEADMKELSKVKIRRSEG